MEGVRVSDTIREEEVWEEYVDGADIVVWKYYKPGWKVEGEVVKTKGDWKFVEDTVPLAFLRGGFRIGRDENISTKPVRRKVEYEFADSKIYGK